MKVATPAVSVLTASLLPIGKARVAGVLRLAILEDSRIMKAIDHSAVSGSVFKKIINLIT